MRFYFSSKSGAKIAAVFIFQNLKTIFFEKIMMNDE
jgi:hypothetical protein